MDTLTVLFGASLACQSGWPGVNASQSMLYHRPLTASNTVASSAHPSHLVQEVTGYREADVRGRGCLCLCGPLTEGRAGRQLLRAHRFDRPAAARLLCYRRDGVPFRRARLPQIPLWGSFRRQARVSITK